MKRRSDNVTRHGEADAVSPAAGGGRSTCGQTGHGRDARRRTSAAARRPVQAGSGRSGEQTIVTAARDDSRRRDSDRSMIGPGAAPVRSEYTPCSGSDGPGRGRWVASIRRCSWRSHGRRGRPRRRHAFRDQRAACAGSPSIDGCSRRRGAAGRAGLAPVGSRLPACGSRHTMKGQLDRHALRVIDALGGMRVDEVTGRRSPPAG